MKSLFWTGLICVVLGLTSLLISVPYVQEQRYQRGSIQLGGPRSEQRGMPGAVAGVLIAGGFGLMIAGCRDCARPQ